MAAPQLTTYYQGIAEVNADGLNTFVQNGANVATLRQFVGIPGSNVTINGYVSPNDGGQGTFYWNNTGTGPDDGGVTTIVPPGAGAGCWSRIQAGVITGVFAGTGLTGGGTIGNVTLNLGNTAVTPGSYTNANIIVNQQGQITSASNGSTSAGDVTGQCKLQYTNSSTITLIPWNGNALVINDSEEEVPDAGVQLSVGAYTANILYYVYSYMVGPTMLMAGSTTGYTTQPGTGFKVKIGDPTMTLVGQFMPISGPAFANAGNNRLVRSWFNEDAISGGSSMPTTSSSTDAVTTVAPNYIELATSSSAYPASLLLWANERCHASCQALAGIANSTPGYQHMMMGINLPGGSFTGSSSLPISQVSTAYTSGTGTAGPININTSFGADGATYNGGSAVNEGLVTLRMFGAVQGGSATWATSRNETNINYITGRS